MSERIQRQRTKGWRMPEGAVYVGRPTKWGNPWSVHVHTSRCDGDFHLWCPAYIADDREGATRSYRHALLYPLSGQPAVPTPDEIRRELRGRDLVCWCPLDSPCHADVLLRLANWDSVDA